MILLISVALVSIFVITDFAVSPQTHKKTIEILDEKKIDVLEITALATATATAISAIPSDLAEPIAGHIIELSSYLFIAEGAILLEKFLIVVTNFLAFSGIVPCICISSIVYIFKRNEKIKKFIVKLCVLTIALTVIIPVSTRVSLLIENIYETSTEEYIEKTEQIAQEIEDETKAIKDEEESQGFFSKVGDKITGLLSKCEGLLSDFMDKLASILITTCILPITVLLFFMWIIKLCFGIDVNPQKLFSVPRAKFKSGFKALPKHSSNNS